MSHAKRHNIGDKTLKDTYSLAFSCITKAILDHYSRVIGGEIAIIVKSDKIAVISNGKLVEVLKLNALDSMFNSVDIQELRRNLKKM